MATNSPALTFFRPPRSTKGLYSGILSAAQSMRSNLSCYWEKPRRLFSWMTALRLSNNDDLIILSKDEWRFLII